MGKNKGNKAKKGSKNTPDATWHGKSEAEPNGKIGSKKTPDATHHGQSEAVANGNIGSQKTPETARQGQTEGEANKIHYEIHRFICHWGYVFMWVCAIAFVVILTTGDKLLSTNYNENLWIIVLSICFMYFIASISAMLALKELPDLLAYILKYAGIFSFIIVGIFTVFSLTSNLFIYIDFDEAFEKTVNSLCIIWWISIISLIATVVSINNPRELKVEVRCFLNFISVWGFLFSLLLIMLMLLVIYCGKNLLGYEFDETFFTISVSIFMMHVLATASVAYVHFSQRNDKQLFLTAATHGGSF